MKESFHINSTNIKGHQRTVTISEIHRLCSFDLEDLVSCRYLIELKLFCFFPIGCTEFPEFSVFVEIPEYSRLSWFVVTLMMLSTYCC